VNLLNGSDKYALIEDPEKRDIQKIINKYFELEEEKTFSLKLFIWTELIETIDPIKTDDKFGN